MNRRYTLIFVAVACAMILVWFAYRSDHQGGKSVYEKLKSGEDIRYLIIGDSIGQGDGAPAANGWSSLLANKLSDGYNSVADPTNITTGGATVLGGWADYIEKLPETDGFDLVFICFGHNDQANMGTDQFGAIYENLIQKIKRDYPYAEIVTLIESSLQSENFPDIIKNLSRHYGIINIDTREAFGKSGVPYDQLTDDGVHPNSKGYALYAEQIYDEIVANANGGKQISSLPGSPLFPASKAFDDRKVIHDWETLSEFGNRGNDLIISYRPGSYAETTFEGDFLGISIVHQDLGATLSIFVDGKLLKEIDTYLSYPFDVNWKHIVADDLSSGKHTVKIEVSSVKNQASKGTAALILGIIGKPAT